MISPLEYWRESIDGSLACKAIPRKSVVKDKVSFVTPTGSSIFSTHVFDAVKDFRKRETKTLPLFYNIYF